MNIPLFFIGILVRHLGPNHDPLALRNALMEIRRVGRSRGSSRAWRQFERFLKAALDDAAVIRAKPEGSCVGPERARNAIAVGASSQKALRRLSRQIRAQCLVEKTEDRQLALQLYRDGRVILEVLPSHRQQVHSVEDVTPSQYALSLNNGRLLWQSQLNAQELVWRRSFPDSPVEMAADSLVLRPARRASVERLVLGGAVVIRVCPGHECGAIEIRVLTPWGGGSHET